MIGKKISPILVEIEDTLLEFEANRGIKPHFTEEGFRASIKIFMSTMMDRMWDVQESDDMEFGNRKEMATRLGEELRTMVKTYTGIDTFDLYLLKDPCNGNSDSGNSR